MYFKYVKKRDGTTSTFDKERIVNAVRKAMQASGEGDLDNDPRRVAEHVVKELLKKFKPDHVPHVEEIQDVVEESLIHFEFPKTAKAYILYRHQRAQLRDQRGLIPERVRQLAAENKKYFRNPLAEFIYYRTYARWLDGEGRRETWAETVDRYVNFMRENLGKSLKAEEYEEIRAAILYQKVMPSMRLLWSAGDAAHASHVAAYNCSYTAPTRLEDFGEIMYLLMCGTGVGFSVEKQLVQQLPLVKSQTGETLATHVIEDSKEGWARAFVLGLKTWYEGKDIAFDYSKLRPAGARLSTMGGRSSGPEPLKFLMEFSRQKILASPGRRLSSLDIHDIVCKIGEIIVAGGVRRSALISLSDLDDPSMRAAKTGPFYLTEPQRSMANNSAVYNEKPSATQFLEEWLALAKSGAGERGIFNRYGLPFQLPERRWKTFQPYWPTCGTNPCVTADTLVYVADGRGHVTIKELGDKGEDVPVFCLDDKGNVVIRHMRNPRLTGWNRPVYKVVLEDGSAIKATADHKLKLKSGEYKKVAELKPGDSLMVLTKYEASIKDIFPNANSRSQDYWWLNSGQTRNQAEHRLVAEFFYNTSIPRGYVVHHRDRDAQNNRPENLQIMTKKAHDALHGELMIGKNNPMQRAKIEWDDGRWAEYRLAHSVNNGGTRNKNFSGVTNEELKEHALRLTGLLGRRFSKGDWVAYAKKHDLPQNFSKWRQNHLGGIIGLAKWAAQELGLEHFDCDPRVAQSYKKYTAQGYNCEIVKGQLQIVKRCEVCSVEFRATRSSREYAVCSIACSLRRTWQETEHRTRMVERLRTAHAQRKERVRDAQAVVYSELKFKLGRPPLKKEWAAACRDRKVSVEISRTSSPFRTYDKLKDFASHYNHRVVSVEFYGYEDVYNGTVDEFHNFFVGGFSSKTRNNKRKFVYINNLQCGEVLLRRAEFCNLTEVVARPDDTEQTLLEKIRIATILGTYQATLTQFPYLSPEWQKNCEEERLLGVSITGQWDCKAVRRPKTLQKLRDYAVEVNQQYAQRFGINPSTAITCVKPSGTVSQLVDSASGLHPRYSPYYIRRVRISGSDPLFHMLREQKFPYYPEVGQQEGSATTYVLEFPVKAPRAAVFRNDLSALAQLEYWKTVKQNYTEHNPSVTIYVGNDEWIEVADWLYKHWEMLGGLSFLPRQEYVYELAPFEEITRERYEELVTKLPRIAFAELVLYEKEDQTTGAKEPACEGAVCEIT